MNQIAIKELVPYSKNSRTHSEAQIKQVMKSIQEFGFTNPILVKDKTIIAGHCRVQAATRLGMEQVPYIQLNYLTAEQARAYVIADNKLALNAGWDDAVLKEEIESLISAEFDINLLGFDESELDDLGIGTLPGGEDKSETEDEVPEVPQNIHGVQRGDVWQLGNHRLVCGDSTSKEDVDRLMNGEKALLMVTDPPYGVEYDPAWRDEAAKKGLFSHATRSVGKVQNDDKADWTEAWKLFDPQVAYVWHAAKMGPLVAQTLESIGHIIISQIIWAKPVFAISRGDYHWQHEPCWYTHKKGKNHNWQGSRSESTLWQINRGCEEKTGHGTEKPVECMERPVRNNSQKGDLVCDPFLGSGTTLIACEKTGRKCYGMELDEHYCSIIIERWQQFTNEKAVKLNG